MRRRGELHAPPQSRSSGVDARHPRLELDRRTTAPRALIDAHHARATTVHRLLRPDFARMHGIPIENDADCISDWARVLPDNC